MTASEFSGCISAKFQLGFECAIGCMFESAIASWWCYHTFVNVACQQFNQIDQGADFLKVLSSVDPNTYENPEPIKALAVCRLFAYLDPYLCETRNRDGEPGDTDGA